MGVFAIDTCRCSSMSTKGTKATESRHLGEGRCEVKGLCSGLCTKEWCRSGRLLEGNRHTSDDVSQDDTLLLRLKSSVFTRQLLLCFTEYEGIKMAF